MSKVELNLADFNTDNENLLQEKPINEQGRPKKQDHEKLSKKLQICVTDAEYEDLRNEFLDSGFPNFGSYMRLKLKKANII